MAKKRIPSHKRSAAKKGAATRKRNAELEAIEKLLGEEFETLAEARRELKKIQEEEKPNQKYLVTITYETSGKPRRVYTYDISLVYLKDSTQVEIANFIAEFSDEIDAEVKFIRTAEHGHIVKGTFSKGEYTDEQFSLEYRRVDR